jgi:hypothetical protein
MIAVAFVLQFGSCLVPTDFVVMSRVPMWWVAGPFLATSVLMFCALRGLTKQLAESFKQQIQQKLEND